MRIYVCVCDYVKLLIYVTVHMYACKSVSKIPSFRSSLGRHVAAVVCFFSLSKSVCVFPSVITYLIQSFRVVKGFKAHIMYLCLSGEQIISCNCRMELEISSGSNCVQVGPH